MLESSVKHKLRISEQGHREDYGVLNKSCNLIGSWSGRNFLILPALDPGHYMVLPAGQ